MKKKMLMAAALAGALVAPAFAHAADAPQPGDAKEKHGCKGKAGKDKESCKGKAAKEKMSCNGKDGCGGKDEKKDEQEKMSCGGKDGCGGKDKKS